MDRPPLEVADLVRVAGSGFIERSRRWITAQHLKVLRAITRCRTAALGGHRDRCVRCGYRVHSFNSCLMGVLPNGECAAEGARAGLGTRPSDSPL